MKLHLQMPDVGDAGCAARSGGPCAVLPLQAALLAAQSPRCRCAHQCAAKPKHDALDNNRYGSKDRLLNWPL